MVTGLDFCPMCGGMKHNNKFARIVLLLMYTKIGSQFLLKCFLKFKQYFFRRYCILAANFYINANQLN